MKEIWVLSVKISFPQISGLSGENFETSFRVFDNFKKGRDAFRASIRKCFKENNYVFDQEGHFLHLKEYEPLILESSEERLHMTQFFNALHDSIFGKDKKEKMDIEIHYDLPFFGENTSLSVCEGCIPELGYTQFTGYTHLNYRSCYFDVYTNMLSMKRKMDYFLYIVDPIYIDGKFEGVCMLHFDLRRAINKIC